MNKLLEQWHKLPTAGKVAVAVGGVGLLYFVYKSKSSSSTTTAANSSPTSLANGSDIPYGQDIGSGSGSGTSNSGGSTGGDGGYQGGSTGGSGTVIPPITIVLGNGSGNGSTGTVVPTPGNTTPPAPTKTVTVKTPSGQTVTGTNTANVVNQAGGEYINHTFYSGSVNAQDVFVGQSTIHSIPTSSQVGGHVVDYNPHTGNVAVGSDYKATVNADGGLYQNHKFVQGGYAPGSQTFTPGYKAPTTVTKPVKAASSTAGKKIKAV